MKMLTKVLLEAVREDAKSDDEVSNLLDEFAVDVLRATRERIKPGVAQFDIDPVKDGKRVRELHKAFDSVLAYMAGGE